MGAVVRTTQRSKSENRFFKRFKRKSGTLVEFWLRFESAMDQQRHTQKKLDNDSKHTCPKMSTDLALEAHRVKVSRGLAKEETVEVTTVRDANRDKNYEVTYCPVIFKASCSYKMLERKGILCRHVLWIYSSNGLKTLPDEYILKRWSKDAIRSGMFDCNGEAAEDIDIIDG
ncbi:protein FAR-RED IMPAIRED RESPONSE 1-like [Silene latifolia]|uniref:protein FAR-RED IMPAIRED RESPONSE 1-like n=1 Tax=Silene latifolia TaxID=37657 RepID=UPI003D777663